MLCYAWDNILKQEGEALLDKEAFENIYNLLSAVLIQAVKKIIKSGFARGYVNYSEELACLKGKINLNDSIKRQSLIKKQLVCEYDIFSEDIIMNRIIKSTLHNLLKCPELTSKYKEQTKILLRHFSQVNEINLSNINWSRIRYNRNNKDYRLSLNTCELLNTGLITKEEKGRTKFATFIKDDAMAKLYEKFILNFYKYELKGYKVSSPWISWQLDEKPSDNLLPIMKTDIELEGYGAKLIIDTKFYHDALRKSNFGETKSLISSNLYQIFAYVKNTDYDGDVSGMLLYPTVDYELDQIYKMSGNKIYVKTVNLGDEFKNIKNRLLNITRVLVSDTHLYTY